MRDVRIIDGAVVTLPDDPACWRPFVRLHAVTRRERLRRYGEGVHIPACQAASRDILDTDPSSPPAP